MPKTRVLLRFLAAAFLVLLCGIVLIGAQKGAMKTKPAATSSNDVNFVRPGLVIKILDANIDSGGVATVHFKLTDPNGLALDRTGVQTPGTISVSFILALIPPGQTQYFAYTTRIQTSPITGASGVQAAGESTGTFKQVGDGEYTYTFVQRVPATDPQSATHSVGAYGSRNLTEFDMGTQYDDDVYSWVPDGSKVSVTRDVIRTASCNNCHYSMGFHGGSRKTMELCVLCHQPQSWDPDTGNTVDMAVMIHKIHQGSGLPSVAAGNHYVIIGNRQSVNDYSDITFPADTRNCQVCHEQGKAAQATNVFKPNRQACGSCHDNVNFATGENHVNLPQLSDNNCASCHPKETDQQFDASILGAHVIPRFAKALPGVVLDIVKVEDASPGKKPTVSFTVKTKAGNPIPPSKWDRLSFRFNGPTTDYNSPVISEDARKAADSPDGVYRWTFVTPIPADAKGTWGLSIEGRTLVTLNPGTKKEIANQRDSGVNKTIYVSVDGKPVVARRQIVSIDKCNVCHAALALHGDARNQTSNCVLCHNPTLVAGTGAAATPVDFKVMIHKIHRGSQLDLPYQIGTTSFNDVGYPGDLRNCAACHVNGSEQPADDTSMLASTMNPAGPVNPVPPITAACTGCHDGIAVQSHALSNTTKLGEACVACHGANSDKSVARVHKP